MRSLSCILAVSFAALTPAMYAGTIPYPNIGTVAPQVTTYATGSGGIEIYFMGKTAAYTDYIQVYDVQTQYKSGDILDNQTTVVGSETTVGAGGLIDAGDQLIFYIVSPEGLFASIANDSADGDNHAYITTYGGGTANGSAIPAGLFVGMEDEAAGRSDFNYNDDTFVFTGVSAPDLPSATPEPSSFILLGTGLLSVAGVARRKFAKR